MNRVYKAELLHENILYLCKIRNIKIGKLEKCCGMSNGYISRMTNGHTVPNVDFVVACSRELGVNAEDLITQDFSRMTQQQNLMLRLIRQMNEDTLQGKLSWKYDVENKLFRAKFKKSNWILKVDERNSLSLQLQETGVSQADLLVGEFPFNWLSQPLRELYNTVTDQYGLIRISEPSWKILNDYLDTGTERTGENESEK